MTQYFTRQEALLGSEAMCKLQAAYVILFGVGGVGSWCAECLIRSGIGHLTIVDFDNVAETNINRQLMATSQTIGLPKVQVLAKRLQEINPEAEIIPINKAYNKDTETDFQLADYQIIIDAIDDIPNKMRLILNATATNAFFLSSMGAASKFNISQIAVAEFWKVQGCPLARKLRDNFKKQQVFPTKKFLCVYSPEQFKSQSQKGTLMHITASFGLRLASLVIEKIVNHKS